MFKFFQQKQIQNAFMMILILCLGVKIYQFQMNGMLKCKKRNYFMLQSFSGSITSKEENWWHNVLKINGIDMNPSLLKYNEELYDMISVGDSILKKRCETKIQIISLTGQTTIYDANYGCLSIECDSLVTRPYLIDK